LARVSSAPGKTITINYYDVDKKLYLVDLPGYGYAKRSKDSQRIWSSLTEDFFVKNPSIDALKLVIQLIDIRTGPTDDDIMMINFLIDNGVKFVVVATKTDKLSKTQLKNAIDNIQNEFFLGTGINILPFSSVTREGKEELWRVISDAIS
jgi:GTP-binding protein